MNKIPATFKTFSRLFFSFSAIFLLAVFADAATFTVTKTADTNDGACDADCSLREAIAAANSVSSDDVIEFDAAVFAAARTITLSGDTLSVAVNGSLTINGTSANRLTVSGNNARRVFYFASLANVTIRRMTITNGNGVTGAVSDCGGGAINSAATSVLEDVIVSNSKTTPFDGTSCLGGGIVNAGNMTIFRSRIENNRNEPGANAAGGGGIFNGYRAILTIRESSVTGNTVSGNGGGINNNAEAILILTNSTVSGNSATGSGGIGGGIINFATVNATHSTVVNNTATVSYGGVSTSDQTGSYTSRNSIYANNLVGANASDFRGPLNSAGYNLIKSTTETVISGDTTGNILNQDPLLLPLASAGIGITLAHKPSASSPVIDKGKTFNIFADQLSVNRPLDLSGYANAPGGDGADIGAIELQYADLPKPLPFDFDGDRKTDISIFRPSDNVWWINFSANNGVYNRYLGMAGDKLVAADYTGDRTTDLAVFRPSNSTWYILRSDFSTLISFQFGASGDIPAPGDFDGDFTTDAAVYRPSTGQWLIRRSSDGVVVTQYFGIAEDKPAVADYDGDGKDDVAIYRPSTGAWWINRSSLGVIAIQFGTAEDKIVQGDYTGDGKADLALWRESNGYWYILRSEDYSYYGFPFGTSGDKPVLGDYDGDGKFDAGIFRPSDNVWYLLRSAQGFSAQQFGTSGDVPLPNAYVR